MYRKTVTTSQDIYQFHIQTLPLSLFQMFPCGVPVGAAVTNTVLATWVQLAAWLLSRGKKKQPKKSQFDIETLI